MIYPLSMMLLLVLVLFNIIFVARMYALYTKKVDLKYYEVFQGAESPKYLTKVTNNLNNLFEVPPIFYMAATLVIVLGIENEEILFNAWGFVATRYLHSLIHITINNYLMRGAVFTLSIYYLAILWLEIIPAL